MLNMCVFNVTQKGVIFFVKKVQLKTSKYVIKNYYFL